MKLLLLFLYISFYYYRKNFRNIDLNNQKLINKCKNLNYKKCYNYENKIQVATISVIVKKNNTYFLLICRRGVKGLNYGKIYTQGGSIDQNETSEQAAIRELYEEAGVEVKENDLNILSIFNVYKNYYVILNNFPKVNGALNEYKSEIIIDNFLSKKYNVPSILDENNKTTGLVWVELQAIEKDIIYENYYFKSIYYNLLNVTNKTYPN